MRTTVIFTTGNAHVNVDSIYVQAIPFYWKQHFFVRYLFTKFAAITNKMEYFVCVHIFYIYRKYI